jgi:hypothetical protein
MKMSGINPPDRDRPDRRVVARFAMLFLLLATALAVTWNRSDTGLAGGEGNKEPHPAQSFMVSDAPVDAKDFLDDAQREGPLGMTNADPPTRTAHQARRN